MQRVLFFIVLIAIAVVAVVFSGLNRDPVEIDYLFARTDWPLAISLGLFFTAGALVGGVLTYLTTWWRMRRRLRQAQRVNTTDKALPAADGDT